MKFTFGLLYFSIFILLFTGCKKDSEPANPYSSVNYNSNTATESNPDPNTIQGLHKNIFFPRCANPGCHDGTFEPDFRTVESSYSTLVYQTVNMVTLDSNKIFSYRVIPHNMADSWLIERLTTSTSDYMPSNSVRLVQSDIDHFKTWINNGCPDINGVAAQKPDLQPNVAGYVAVDSAFHRIDTIRVSHNPLLPFIIPEGSTATIAFIALDTADCSAAVDPGQFTVKQIQFTTVKDDYSSAVTVNAYSYISGYQAWLVNIPTTTWTSGTTVYFRIAVNDGHHSSNAVFPRYESIDYYKTIYAFKIQ
jgi:hypothetical protein